MKFLESIFFVELDEYNEIDEEEEAKKEENGEVKEEFLFGFNTVQERNEAFDKVLCHMKENYGTIYRSKGKQYFCDLKFTFDWHDSA